jgi:hypothetical protein
MNSFEEMDLNNELFTKGLPLNLQRITSESPSEFDYPFTVAYNSNYFSVSWFFSAIYWIFNWDLYLNFKCYYKSKEIFWNRAKLKKNIIK